MEFVLYNLLTTLGITAVVEVERVRYRELSAVCYKYIHDGEYCKTTSFYTTSWIGPSPFGPSLSEDGDMVVATLEDIATIEKYNSLRELKLASAITQTELKGWYKEVDVRALAKMKELFIGFEGHIVEASFSFYPTPCIIVSLSRDRKVLGSLAVQSSGDIMVLSHTSAEIFDIVDSIKMKALPGAF